MPRHEPPFDHPELPSAATLVSRLPIPIILIAENGRIVMVNAVAAAAFGETENALTDRLMTDTPLPEALGVDALQLVAMSDDASPAAIYHEHRGTVYRFVVRGLAPTGDHGLIALIGRDITHLQYSGGSIDSTREALEMVIKERTRELVEANDKFRHQINERLQVEKELRTSEKKYRSIFENIQDVYVETSLDGIILEISPSVGNLFSYRRDELVGKSLLDIYADPLERSDVVAALVSDGSIKNHDIRLRDKDGSLHHCLISAQLIVDDTGNAVKVASSLRDITALKKTEAELERTRETLYQAQKMKALGALVAGVAHEINNPINLILFNLPLFKDLWWDIQPTLKKAAAGNGISQIGGLPLDYLEENLGQLIEDTELAAKRIAAIVSNLKEFYRRSETSDMAVMNLNGAVENALRLAGASLRKAGISVDVALSPNLPDMFGNLQSIEQVCLNIILNAVEAIDQDNGRIDVLTGQSDGGGIFLSIADNGKGIAPDIAQHIFDPFVTDKQSGGGTGLGLSISYSLVQAHRGEIKATDRTGGGSIFTATFPTANRFRSAKIMVVDDDDMFLGFIAEQLQQRSGYQVLAISGGIEACLRLGTYQPDIVVLDVFMPEVDGLEVCQIMKRDPVLSRIPVIITTGQPGHPMVAEIRALGYTRIVEKPLRIETLMDAIGQVLNP